MSGLKNVMYMETNVILTFDKCGGKFNDSQEMIDFNIPISKLDINLYAFMYKKFFPRVVKSCAKLSRSPRDLIKISSCFDWDIFTKLTNTKSLDEFGHSCKWKFGNGRNDLDPWEKHLMEAFEFGQDADMSNVNDHLITIQKWKEAGWQVN